MTKNIQTKGKLRRPAKKRSSLSPRPKSLPQAVKAAVKKFALTKITIFERKKNLSNPAKVRTVSQKARQTRLVSLPLGSKVKLVLALQHTKPLLKKTNIDKANNKKSAKPAKKTRSKKQELIFASILLIAGLCGAAFFGLQTLASPTEPIAKPSKPTTKLAVPAPKTQPLPRSLPTRLRVPAIELDNTLTTVGMAPDSSIEVPPDYTRAGWYRLSPTPGEIGPAIIVGHLDNIHGLAVFWRLKELVPGQVILVDREDGKTAQFVIDKVEQFPQDSFPNDKVYGNTDHAELRLITCGGTFNHLTQHYSDNTVVFASLAPSSP